MQATDLSVDPGSNVPPFEQIRSRVAGMVAGGELLPGTRLPTVRQLAGDLGLAANTVARAYKELEADGVVVTHGRRGTFVRSELLSGSGPESVPGPVLGVGERARQAAAGYVEVARRLGLSAPEAVQLVENAWHQNR